MGEGLGKAARVAVAEVLPLYALHGEAAGQALDLVPELLGVEPPLPQGPRRGVGGGGHPQAPLHGEGEEVGHHLGVPGIVQLKLVQEEVAKPGKAPGPFPEAQKPQGVGELLKGEEGLGTGGLQVGRHQEVGLPHPEAPVQVDPLGPGHPGAEETPGTVLDPTSQALLGQGLGGVAGVRAVGLEGGSTEAGGRGEALKEPVQVHLGVAFGEAHTGDCTGPAFSFCYPIGVWCGFTASPDAAPARS